MTKIFNLKIRNFRGIKEFKQVFNDNNVICIIGRGDSGKSTILDAISYVLSSNWNLTFYDSDFYNCDTSNPIEIEVTLSDLPESLLREDKYGLYIRGIDKTSNEIKDELEDGYEIALSIKLEVTKDLEPNWYVINNRYQEPVKISSRDRAKLNVFIISDYIDRHFSWNRYSPLYSLLKQYSSYEDSNEQGVLTEILREIKEKIDTTSFQKFDNILDDVKTNANKLGVDMLNISTSIDLRDIIIKEGKLSLHEKNIPIRLRGKGSKRLLSMAIQLTLAKNKGGIILIDEIEQALEPDRIRHLVHTLKKYRQNQIFITTHSRDVIVELETKNLFLMKKNSNSLISVGNELQGVVRKNPEALFAKKIIVCEGATEIGICRVLNDYRINNNKQNMAYCGIVLADGTGSNLISYSKGFRELGFNVCLFCDSDKEDINKQKENLYNQNIQVFDCEEGNSIEDQVFKNLPWEKVLELVSEVKKIYGEESIEQSIKAKYKKDNWQKEDNENIRTILGEIGKANKWFKRIDYGEILGKVILEGLENIKDKPLGIQIKNLLKWIENEC